MTETEKKVDKGFWATIEALLFETLCGRAKKKEGREEFRSMDSLDEPIDGFSAAQAKKKGAMAGAPAPASAALPAGGGMVDPSAMRGSVAASNPSLVSQTAAPKKNGAAPSAASANGSSSKLSPTGKAAPTATGKKDDEYSEYVYEYAYEDEDPGTGKPAGATKKPGSKGSKGKSDEYYSDYEYEYEYEESGKAPTASSAAAPKPKPTGAAAAPPAKAAAPADDDGYYEYSYSYGPDSKDGGSEKKASKPAPVAAEPSSGLLTDKAVLVKQ